MKITAITAACNRPEAWKLSEDYMRRQTVKPDQWIVLDSDDPPSTCTMGQHFIYCPEVRGKSEMIEKLKIAFSPGLITGDIVVMWENDDHYAPTWIETCVKNLGDGRIDLFGEGRAVYYNVRDRWWFDHANMSHASLCSTAFTKRLYPLVHRLCSDPNPFIDDRLWKNASGNRKRLLDPLSHGGKRLVVGIKAMPGKVGYGSGHTREDRNAKQDPDGAKLRELIGDDAALYEPFWRDYVPSAPAVELRVPAHTETGRVRGPKWMKWLAHLAGQPNITGLEIGTFRGDSAEFMCENIFTHETARYYCVDPFEPGGSVDHVKAGVDCTENESTARLRLSVFPQVRIIKEYSNNALRRFNMELDWAYVDGAHDAMNCLRDSVLAFDALKVGGILCWDDVTWGGAELAEHDKPKIAVDAFLACYKTQIEVLMHGGWQSIVRKIKA